MIISSHNTQFLEDLCDRVLLFENHKLAKIIDMNKHVDLEAAFLNAAETDKEIHDEKDN